MSRCPRYQGMPFPASSTMYYLTNLVMFLRIMADSHPRTELITSLLSVHLYSFVSYSANILNSPAPLTPIVPHSTGNVSTPANGEKGNESDTGSAGDVPACAYLNFIWICTQSHILSCPHQYTAVHLPGWWWDRWRHIYQCPRWWCGCPSWWCCWWQCQQQRCTRGWRIWWHNRHCGLFSGPCSCQDLCWFKWCCVHPPLSSTHSILTFFFCLYDVLVLSNNCCPTTAQIFILLFMHPLVHYNLTILLRRCGSYFIILHVRLLMISSKVSFAVPVFC